MQETIYIIIYSVEVRPYLNITSQQLVAFLLFCFVLFVPSTLRPKYMYS